MAQRKRPCVSSTSALAADPEGRVMVRGTRTGSQICRIADAPSGEWPAVWITANRVEDAGFNVFVPGTKTEVA